MKKRESQHMLPGFEEQGPGAAAARSPAAANADPPARPAEGAGSARSTEAANRASGMPGTAVAPPAGSRASAAFAEQAAGQQLSAEPSVAEAITAKQHATQVGASQTAPVQRPALPPAAEQPSAEQRSASQPSAEDGGTAPDPQVPTVWVVDAHNLIFQVFHAVPEMTSPAGEAVNAVFGLTRDLLYLLETKRPTYLFVAFDLSGATFRHELYEGYKRDRPDMPEELVPQIAKIRELLSALGIPLLECAGFEADDILATVARQAEERGWDCYLVTGDKDCRQLITDRVRLYNVRKNQVLDREGLLAEWGIRPEQVVDFQALVGDTVDQIPGVPLIGPKNASELLQRYGTLQQVLEHADAVPGAKRRENLKRFGQQALLSRELVRLRSDVPLEFDWEQGRVERFPLARAEGLFATLGFHRLGAQLRRLAVRKEKAPPPRVAAEGADPREGSQAARHGALLETADGSQGALWESAGEEPNSASSTVGPAEFIEAPWQADYRTVGSLAQLEELISCICQAGVVSFDTETTSIRPADADLVGCSLAWQEGLAYYVPLRAPAGEPCLNPMAALAVLRPMLEDPAVGKVGQNLKFDMVALRTVGIDMRGLRFDSMMASYLLDAGERVHNLDELARRYLRHTNIKITELIGTGRSQKRMDEVPVAQITKYAAEDADVALRLYPLLENRLQSEGLYDLFTKLELPLVEVLAAMEATGICVDVERLAALSNRYEQKLAELEAEIYRLAGRTFNIASTQQTQQVLFSELKLPTRRRTLTGASTNVEVLAELARLHPLPARIIEYRQYAKLKSTYVDALPALVNPRTGRVHASFHQAVAATGRLSSSNPNLQNIPVRTEEGRAIRAAFVPGEPDWKLLTADYSQIELRILAHFSQDEALLEAFARDEDIHARVAAEVCGVPLSNVTDEMRRRAKAVNFGVIYGQSPAGLARNLGISQEEAAAFIDAYFARYRGVDKFIAQTLAECFERGYVKTILGRRRTVRGVRRVVGRQRNLPERTAINTVIQGSAADLIKQAMVAIHRGMQRERLAARMLLQIHDELVFEVPAEEVNRLARLVCAEMTGVGPLSVPLKIDLQVGPNWAEAEEWAL